jgi:S-adenosylmethionine synthetase
MPLSWQVAYEACALSPRPRRRALATPFDPSLQATREELQLARVNYENCARMGHFGRDVPW